MFLIWTELCWLTVIIQLYRLERYSECKSIYTDLIRNSQDEYDEERKTNLAAVVAAMSQWEKAPLVKARLLRHGSDVVLYFVWVFMSVLF